MLYSAVEIYIVHVPLSRGIGPMATIKSGPIYLSVCMDGSPYY